MNVIVIVNTTERSFTSDSSVYIKLLLLLLLLVRLDSALDLEDLCRVYFLTESIPVLGIILDSASHFFLVVCLRRRTFTVPHFVQVINDYIACV